MGHIVPETILTQVRQLELRRLTDHARVDPAKKNELYDFLVKEPVHVSQDQFQAIMLSADADIGFVKTDVPTFNFHNPKPKLKEISPSGLKSLGKQVIRYFVVKVLATFLPKVMAFNTEVRPMAVVLKDGSLVCHDRPGA